MIWGYINASCLNVAYMSNEKIERILATYEPVDNKPGYVWVRKGESYVELDILREAYEEHFKEGSK